MGTSKPSQDIYYTTGCTLMNMVASATPKCYGFRGGVLTRIIAKEGGGKSFTASECVAHNHHKLPKFNHRYIDRETRYRFDTQKLYNMDIIEAEERSPSTIAELEADLNSWLHHLKTPGVYVIDSLEAFSSDDVEERSEARRVQYEKGKEVLIEDTMGMQAPKFLAQEFFKSVMETVAEKKVALLALSQVRENIGGGKYSPKLKKTGGKSTDHWVDTELWLQPVRDITVGTKGEKDFRKIGVVIECKASKSTGPWPYRTCYYSLYFEYGIDNIGSNLDYLFDLRGKDHALLTSSNAIRWDQGEPKTLVTMSAFMEEKGILDECKAWFKETTGRSTIVKDTCDTWLSEHKVHGKEFSERFASEVYSRDELIKKIEETPEMEKELEQRVIAKWEGFEAAATPNRRSKFG